MKIEEDSDYPDASIVGWGEYSVSQRPLASLGFSDCCSISLTNGSRSGLSHIGPPNPNPNYHLNKMIDKFDVPPESLKAIIVSTADSEDRNNLLEQCCLDRGIEIAGKEYEGDGRPRKDILVVPSSKEVRIYYDFPRGEKVIREF